MLYLKLNFYLQDLLHEFWIALVTDNFTYISNIKLKAIWLHNIKN
jgi:hypothetical protein